MGTLAQDIRYGLRVIRKSPGFAAVTIAVLALGVGANTSIFSVVHAVLLKPLPFQDPARLMSVRHVPPQDIFPGRKTFAVSPANYFDWKAQNDVFEKMAIWAYGSVTLTGQGRPQPLEAAYVAADFFDVLGARPLAGRLFAAGDDEDGHDVAVLSQEVWKSRFGGDPGVIGRTLLADGRSYTIVGVLPAGLAFPAESRVWLPLTFTAEERAIRGIHDYGVLARLARGTTLETARTHMNALAARLAAQYPADNKGWGATVDPLHEEVVGDVRPALLVLLGAVAFVLLIACANVANLLLAKTLGRRKEIAVRTALGAGRADIVRQIFIETILLSLCGAAVGLALAGLGVRLITAFLGGQLPQTGDIRIDGTVLAFTFAVAIVTGCFSAAIPAWRLTHADPNEALKQGGRADVDSGSSALRNGLVTAEVALALVLLFGAGLLVRSLGRLRAVDVGFNPSHVIHAQISLPDGRYATPDTRIRFYERALARVRALPGVTAAGAINTLPLTHGGSTQPVAIEGAPAARLSEQPEVAVRVLTPGALPAFGMRLLEGRDFADADTESAPAVVLVSEAMAKKFWPGQSAVGKRLTLTFAPQSVRQVVGVVADVKLLGVAHTTPVAALYAPHSQLSRSFMSIVARTQTDPRGLSRALEAAIHEIDPDLAVLDMATMEDQAASSLSQERFNVMLLAVFAALALLLSAVGIYSVLAYTVRRRTREIGIRMALGADARQLVAMVVRQGMRPALIGLAVGIGASLALGRFLSSLIFGIAPTDLATFAAASALLTLVALLACALPAWRATRVEPTSALQEG